MHENLRNCRKNMNIGFRDVCMNSYIKTSSESLEVEEVFFSAEKSGKSFEKRK